ncbi:MAG: hypothetical protein ACFFCW_11640 [Candidatus Hodarchaeota archaeon]
MKTRTNNSQNESIITLLIFLFIIILLSGCAGLLPTTHRHEAPNMEAVASRNSIVITPKVLYPAWPRRREVAPQPIGTKVVSPDDGHFRVRVKDLPPWWQLLFTPKATDRIALLEQEPAHTKDLVVDKTLKDFQAIKREGDRKTWADNKARHIKETYKKARTRPPVVWTPPLPTPEDPTDNDAYLRILIFEEEISLEQTVRYRNIDFPLDNPGIPTVTEPNPPNYIGYVIVADRISLTEDIETNGHDLVLVAKEINVSSSVDSVTLDTRPRALEKADYEQEGKPANNGGDLVFLTENLLDTEKISVNTSGGDGQQGGDGLDMNIPMTDSLRLEPNLGTTLMWGKIDLGRWYGLRVKRPGEPAIYLIDEGKKRHIPNVATYNRLFRNWSGIREDLNIENCPEGNPIPTFALLFRCTGSPKVYLLDGENENRIKRHIASPYVMDEYHFDWSKVQEINCSVTNYPDGPVIKGNLDGTVVSFSMPDDCSLGWASTGYWDAPNGLYGIIGTVREGAWWANATATIGDEPGRNIYPNDGKPGGPGGLPGKVSLISSSLQSDIDLHVTAETGEDGQPGVGGKGGDATPENLYVNGHSMSTTDFIAAYSTNKTHTARVQSSDPLTTQPPELDKAISHMEFTGGIGIKYAASRRAAESQNPEWMSTSNVAWPYMKRLSYGRFCPSAPQTISLNNWIAYEEANSLGLILSPGRAGDPLPALPKKNEELQEVQENWHRAVYELAPSYPHILAKRADRLYRQGLFDQAEPWYYEVLAFYQNTDYAQDTVGQEDASDAAYRLTLGDMGLDYFGFSPETMLLVSPTRQLDLLARYVDAVKYFDESVRDADARITDINDKLSLLQEFSRLRGEAVIEVEIRLIETRTELLAMTLDISVVGHEIDATIRANQRMASLLQSWNEYVKSKIEQLRATGDDDCLSCEAMAFYMEGLGIMWSLYNLANAFNGLIDATRAICGQ